MSIGSAIFAELTSVTDWHHATQSVTTGHIYVHGTAMQPKMSKHICIFSGNKERNFLLNSNSALMN